jgi:hypothetical protein
VVGIVEGMGCAVIYMISRLSSTIGVVLDVCSPIIWVIYTTSGVHVHGSSMRACFKRIRDEPSRPWA